MQRNAFPIWPLPLAIVAALVVATHLAWWLSIRDGHIESCIPYLEGCTSISRAARHGLGNHLFRLLVLPCALLVFLHWWLAGRWLQLRGGSGRMMIVLGAVAALALAVYATFLGTEGEIYRFLRRHGVVVYFGCSYLAQLLFLRRARLTGPVDPVARRAMLVICVAMLALGLLHVAVAALIGGSELQDRLENVFEWHLGVLLVAWFAAHARLWWRDDYRLEPARG